MDQREVWERMRRPRLICRKQAFKELFTQTGMLALLLCTCTRYLLYARNLLSMQIRAWIRYDPHPQNLSQLSVTDVEIVTKSVPSSTGRRAVRSVRLRHVSSQTKDRDLSHAQVIKVERQGTRRLSPRILKVLFFFNKYFAVFNNHQAQFSTYFCK